MKKYAMVERTLAVALLTLGSCVPDATLAPAGAGQGGDMSGSMGGAQSGGGGGMSAGIGGSSNVNTEGGNGGLSLGNGGAGGAAPGGGTGGSAATPNDGRCGPPVANPELVTWQEIFELVEEDVLRQDTDDRPFIRYLGITNRHNAGAPACELDAERGALFKAVNSLSRQSVVRQPVEVDSRGLIYRIDLRDFNLDDGLGPFSVDGVAYRDGWEAIIDLNAFAVPFLGDSAENVALQTDTAVPFLYSDALIDAAFDGNLYYELLRVPDTLDELLLDQEVDVLGNVDQVLAVFAGMTRSPISTLSRVARRDPSDSGAGLFVWQSFDLTQPLDQSILDGPNATLTYSRSEALFTLPNGLLAYALFDANGNRLEQDDTLNPNSIDAATHAAVGCMACHTQGPLAMADEVRAFVQANPLDFDADTFDDLLELYPAQAELDRQMADDRTLTAGALARAGIGADAGELISSTYERFDRDMTLIDVAGDLAVSPSVLVAAMNTLDPALSGLDDGFSVDRDDFKALFADSLCRLTRTQDTRADDALCASLGVP